MGRMWRPGRDIKTQTRFPTENRYLYSLDSEARIIYLMIAGVQFKCRYKVRCCTPSGHVTLDHPGDASPPPLRHSCRPPPQLRRTLA